MAVRLLAKALAAQPALAALVETDEELSPFVNCPPCNRWCRRPLNLSPLRPVCDGEHNVTVIENAGQFAVVRGTVSSLRLRESAIDLHWDPVSA